ncbi:hypothetical protein PMAYCL1PPCAC_27374, partial [Pristionchus mayeri]
IPVSSHAQNPQKEEASGNMEKAPDSNWEFEYGSPANAASSDEEKDVCKPAAATSFKGLEGNVINLVLRLRNEAGELNDVKIDFWSGERG